MRILLISANLTSINMPVFPLGPASVGTALRQEGHDVEILDLLENEDPRATVAEVIRAFRPELIGLSVRNIDNQNPFDPMFFLPAIRSIVQTCREASAAPIVIGGAGYSIFPRAALEFLGGDWGVVGEGERALGRIARALENAGDAARIPGVIRRGDLRANRRAPIRNLDRLAAPARGLLDAERYAARGMMPIQGKRGCHMKCTYCSSPLIEGRSVRLRSPERIAGEMESALERHGIDSFYFVDNLFNYPQEHAIRLCEAIVARGLRVQWRCIINPLHVSRRLVRSMKRAGCVEVSLGFESGSERMLRAFRKGFDTAAVRRASQVFRAFGIGQVGFLLLGGPGEDRASVEESFAFAEALRPEALKVTIGVRIYPGTALAAQALREGVIAPEADLLTPTFYLSNAVRDWLPERAREAAESHPAWRL